MHGELSSAMPSMDDAIKRWLIALAVDVLAQYAPEHCTSAATRSADPQILADETIGLRREISPGVAESVGALPVFH